MRIDHIYNAAADDVTLAAVDVSRPSATMENGGDCGPLTCFFSLYGSNFSHVSLRHSGSASDMFQNASACERM